MQRWVRRSVVTALVLLAALLQACSGGGTVSVAEPTATIVAPQQTPVSGDLDPSAPGPYPVGVTEITFQRPSSTGGDPRVLSTHIWYPAVDGAKTAPQDDILKGVTDAELARDDLPLPIIMFSHGSGGTTWQSTFYTTHLASYGFVVVAPPHPGNTAADCLPCVDAEGLIDSFLNRPADMTFVLESMLKLNADPTSLFYQALDGNRVGISGHSFGGLDVVRMAAEGSGTPFAAALAMAPAGGVTVPAIAGSVDIPLMLMGGERDKACPVEIQRDYFETLQGNEPRYLVVFPRGAHLAYADQCVAILGGCGPDDISQEKAHDLVNFYATAFFETYVAGDQRYATYLDPQTTVGDPDVEYEVRAP
jgi:predicted dienelactone hydrolase